MTFRLYSGPQSDGCTAGNLIETSPPRPITFTGGPPATGGTATYTFAPASAGTYHWVASFSGDANNGPITAACSAINETSTLAPVQPAINTQAANGTVGGQIGDTATVSGLVNPVTGVGAGTVTFRLYSGPQSDGCTVANLVDTFVRPITFTGGPPVTGGTATVTYTPATAGTYHWIASFSGDANNAAVTAPCGADNETSILAPAQPAINTQAANGTVGGQIGDTATVTGLVNPVTTGGGAGTVTFLLYSGPQSDGCTAANLMDTFVRPITFTGGPPATGGTATVTYTPATAGTYHWIASFSGDANNAAVTAPCGADNETSILAPAAPAIDTQASNGAIGGSIGDVATVSGLVNPVTTGPGAGTVTFRLYSGPQSDGCTAANLVDTFVRPITFTGGPPATGGTATVTYTPAAPGTFHWVASFSGDTNNAAVTAPCGADNETSAFAINQPAITTQASNGTFGGSIGDVATITGLVNPVTTGGGAGTVTFRLYSGPQTDGCTAANLVFTSTPRPITFTGGPPATGGTASVTYTPAAPGTYHWVESFSGDANNAPVSGACNAPNETSTLIRNQPAITTQASNGTVGGSIGDTATITGLVNPVTTGGGAGTVTFRLYSGPQTTAARRRTSCSRPRHRRSRSPAVRRRRVARRRSPTHRPPPGPTTGWSPSAATPTTSRPRARVTHPTRPAR